MRLTESTRAGDRAAADDRRDLDRDVVAREVPDSDYGLVRAWELRAPPARDPPS